MIERFFELNLKTYAKVSKGIKYVKNVIIICRATQQFKLLEQPLLSNWVSDKKKWGEREYFKENKVVEYTRWFINRLKRNRVLFISQLKFCKKKDKIVSRYSYPIRVGRVNSTLIFIRVWRFEKKEGEEKTKNTRTGEFL